MSTKELKELLDEVVDTYKKYGIPEQTIGGMEHPVANELLKKANKNGLEMTIVPFMHAGTTNGRRAYYLLQTELQSDDRIDMLFNTHVDDVIVENGAVKGIVYTKNKQTHKIYAPNVVLATGRAGASWNKEICSKHSIPKMVKSKLVYVMNSQMKLWALQMSCMSLNLKHLKPKKQMPQ